MSFKIRRKEFIYNKIEYKYLGRNDTIDTIDTIDNIKTVCSIKNKNQVLKKHKLRDEIIFSGTWEVTLSSSIFFADLDIDCILDVSISEKELLESNNDNLLKEIQEKSIQISLNYINDELNRFLRMTPSQPSEKINFIKKYREQLNREQLK